MVFNHGRASGCLFFCFAVRLASADSLASAPGPSPAAGAASPTALSPGADHLASNGASANVSTQLLCQGSLCHAERAQMSDSPDVDVRRRYISHHSCLPRQCLASPRRRAASADHMHCIGSLTKSRVCVYIVSGNSDSGRPDWPKSRQLQNLCTQSTRRRLGSASTVFRSDAGPECAIRAASQQQQRLPSDAGERRRRRCGPVLPAWRQPV